MKEKNVQFWQDNKGRNSSTRIISFLFALWFFWFVPSYLSDNVIDVNFLTLIGELLLAIFAPKYIKQYLENRVEKKTEA